ncbi:glycoside hydrolase family 97 protein [Amphiplicatus metriothermophilus]|uniref:Alpha-glucosidase n=1 Tax=Amphiplicatus metriothermophilus TaxID=1519374 RepID=A0A239PVE1_9PROT|nr:glycoside hydrolase family 97 protein [Amphiplicatus metriothermophilus]MBB5519707.1 alpha-glucosidase [Amphiplicatus metriothermophilus]SNT74269.1 alpha-glucosidase [Amphiplicatus metriothermophilus]
MRTGRIWAATAAGLAAAFAGFGAASAEEARLSSPDGEIVVTVTDEGGLARYAVEFRGETLIAPSRLGLLFKDQHGFDDGLAIASVKRAAKDEIWEQPWGERRFVRDRHNELLVEFVSREGPARRFFARFRAFDDGIGFRYEVPRQKRLGKVEIVEELTEFAAPAGSTAWWIPARQWNRYEYLYETTPVEEVYAAHTPITLRAPSGAHLSIHEAALVDYSGMALKQARPATFRADLAPWSDGVLVKTETPFASPWRTIQIAPDAVGLLNSDLILNLNEPNRLGDVSWVEPGKYVGIWWAMHIRERTWGRDGVHGATTEEAKRYIDFAAKYGFKGVLVEGWNVGWDGDWYNNGDVFSFTEAYPDFDIEEVAAYAREKGVRLIGHHETSGNVANYENQLADAFDLYERLGVRQVKTGYVADAGRIKRVDEKGIARYEYHDGQFMANHHLRVLEEAAKRKISINAHEPIKDTGLRRTYPNWIAREGARGQEFNAWGLPPNPPEHTAILPYTRMLSGPMDFTPGIFDLEPNRRPPVREDMPRHDPASRVQTTLAKQLALYVVLYSPIQMAADLPENYEKRPDAFQFILDAPTDWEESRALAGEAGDYVVFARKERGGEDWFVGALTDEEARDLTVPLDFLDEGRAYVAEIYRDGPDAHWETNPYALVVEERRVTRADALALPLAPGGGAAARLRPAP